MGFNKLIIIGLMGLMFIGLAGAFFYPSGISYSDLGEDAMGLYYQIPTTFRPWVIENIEQHPLVNQVIDDGDTTIIDIEDVAYNQSDNAYELDKLANEFAIQEKMINVNFNTRFLNPKQVEYWQATNGQLVVCGILHNGGQYTYTCVPS